MFGKFLVLAILLLPSIALADEPGRHQEQAAPFCGIRSLYTSLQIEGINVDFAALLQPRYVPSAAGSTFAALHDAAIDNHAYAELRENLSVADLTAARLPSILHVRSELDSRDFDHFVVCVPSSNGLLVCDAPEHPRLISTGELSAIWDGSAMMVSAHPLPRDASALTALLRGSMRVLPVLSLLIVFAAIHTLRVRRPVTRPLRFQVAILVGIAASASILFNGFAVGGLVRNLLTAQAIARSMTVAPAHQIGLAAVRQQLQAGGVVVDARKTADFQEAHIPGAVNISPDSSRTDRERLLGALPKSAPVVVYCASPTCPNAALIANRLGRDGFTDVAVFVGGWEAWLVNHQPVSQR